MNMITLGSWIGVLRPGSALREVVANEDLRNRARSGYVFRPVGLRHGSPDANREPGDAAISGRHKLEGREGVQPSRGKGLDRVLHGPRLRRGRATRSALLGRSKAGKRGGLGRNLSL